jgi:hypothetical protein
MRPLLLLLPACAIETGLTEETPEALPGGDSGVVPDTQEPETPPCALTLAAAGEIAQVSVCLAPTVVVTEPWSVELEWQWSGGEADGEVHHVIAMPAVGNLTDDDGDGRISETDVPDVVFVAGVPGDWADARSRLVVLDGATGEEHWSRTGFYWLSGVALADVDADGEIEIVTTDSDRHPVVVSAAGEVEWTASVTMRDPQNARDYPAPMVADLWGDGSPEVIFDVFILDGATGALVTELSREGSQYTIPTIGDPDLDGIQEIILYNRMFEPDGTEVWQSSMVESKGFWSAIVNTDDDDEGEVVMLGGGQLGVYDPDGTVLLEVEVASSQPGPPCVADFDGDGQAEIAWANSTSLRLYELDGTEVWARCIVDDSGLAGCSGYDVNGDGAYEVLYADEQTFTIYDGTSGSAKYTYTEHTSATVWEYPVVADIDGDLSAEIVFASNDTQETGGWAGITALGHPESGWLASGPTWHVHDFSVTNINPDGSVPASPEPPWLAYNVYRARPAMDRDMGMDLIVTITDICADGPEPDDLVRIAVQVANQGVWTVPDGVPVAAFGTDGASLSLGGLANTDEAIPTGIAAAGMELTMPRASLGTDGITVRVDELGAGVGVIEECDEANNATSWSGTLP